MKALAAPALLSMLCAVSGCSSAALTRAEVDARLACDVVTMDRIDREARRDFKEVRWLRCPQAVRRPT
jgi:hypothetical protein